MTNPSQDITKKQFQGQLKEPLHKQTLQSNTYMDKKSRIFERNVIPAGIYLFKINNRNTRARYEIGLKLTIKTLKNDSNTIVLVSLLLTLNTFYTLFQCLYSQFVRRLQPPLFSGTHPLIQLAPVFKNLCFPSPLFLLRPLSRYSRQSPPLPTSSNRLLP